MRKLSAAEKKSVEEYIKAKNRIKDYQSDSLWMTCADVVLLVIF